MPKRRLRAALEDPWLPDGIVVVAEAGRLLAAADVTGVLGVPVDRTGTG